MDQVEKKLFSSERTGALAAGARDFLAAFGTPALMGGAQIFGAASPGDRFRRLISACGFEDDPEGFFRALGDQILARPAGGICLGGVDLPVLLLYHLLEIDGPGQSLLTVKGVGQLEKATGERVLSRSAIQAVLDLYPVRLSRHVIRQSMVSPAVAAQYFPFEEELDAKGHTLTFDGHFKQGLMEQMYRNRAIFLLDMRCPVYCRFCFRKHKSLRQEKSPGPRDVARAVARVRENPEIKEILITGGEPLINRNNMEAALAGLMEIDHVKTLRIATRSLAYYPHLFLHHDRELVSRLKAWQKQCRDRGKSIEIGVHMVHPDEVSIQSLDLISHLTASGIPVYVQTPLLRGINHRGEVLEKLFTLLRHAGAEIYYIFTPCHPIHGTQKYWSPISLSFDAYAHLRARISDRAVPKLCTATPLGKMEWETSGWAVEPDSIDADHIWIRTPYTRDFFGAITREGLSLPHIRDNKGGTLDVKCLIQMGDDALFSGERELADPGAGPGEPVDPETLQKIQDLFYQDSAVMETEALAPCPGIRQLHPARVQMELDAGPGAMDLLAAHDHITDIVLRVPDTGEGIDSQIGRIRKVMDGLERFGDRPFYLRIRWEAFYSAPQAFGPEAVERIAGLARLDFARPRRVEIETWWLTPDQITPAHRALGRSFLAAGVPVYANLALVSGINDDPGLVARTAHALRDARVDFHHVYTSGLKIQNRFNRTGPVTHDRVCAIASHVRMVCSGREIPLYVKWTPRGERDFGLDGKWPLTHPRL